MCKKFEDFEKEALQYKQILLDYREKGKVFCDPNFHPESKIPESKVKIDSEIKWNRIDSIYPASLFNPDLINPRFIQNGENVNLSFISVLLHLSSQPYLIPYLFDHQSVSILGKVKNSINLKCGAIVVYFHAFGRKTPVLIDTRIPCGSDGTPLFTKLNDSTKSPWFILVEKAFAKLCESYSGIHSNNFTSSMYFIYGYYGAGVYHSFNLKKNKRSPFESILHFKQKKAFIEASTTTFKFAKEKSSVTINGLSKDHSYSIIDIKQFEDKNFFLLRNPEGVQSWNGDWSLESPLWTPEMKKDFHLENLTPGTFWMIESDFFKNFGNFEIVKPIKRKWHKRCILYQIPKDLKSPFDQFGFQVAEYTPDEKVSFHIIGERRHQLVDENGNLNPEPPNWAFSSISLFSSPFNVICASPSLTKIENKMIKITHTGKYSLIDEVFVSIYCKYDFILYNQKLPDELIPEDEKEDDRFLYFGEIIDDFLSGKLKYDLEDDELHQTLIGKSDKNSDNYDILIHGSNNIEKVVLQPTIKRICNYAFHSCSILKTIEIPENSELKSIGKNAFVEAPINHIFIPEKVEELQDGWCFINNYQYDIGISPKNRFFKYLNDENQMILNIKKNSIVFANKSIIEAEIPSYITEIESFSFFNCKQLKTVKFSENSSLKKIGKHAFRNTSIQYFTIPKSVEQINKRAFYSCVKLKKVEIEEESKLQSIPDFIFCLCNELESVKIPEKSEIKIIQRKSFSFCPITHIYIPSTVEEIDENWCMYNKKLVDIKVSPKNKNFKVHCGMLFGKSDNDSENFDIIKLACKNISNTIIPDNVKYIEPYAFQHCVNLNIEISDESELKILGKSAFHYCDNLLVFNIPKGLKFIGTEAFHYSNIKSLYIPASLEELEEGWCSSTKKLKKVTISPENKLFKYLDEQKEILISKSDKNSSEYDSIIFCKRDVKHIKIPTYIKHIQSHSFEYCNELTTIEIPENSQLQTIGKNAFSNTNIKEITIRKNIESIEKEAFESCRSLEKVKFEKGSKLKNLPNNAFIFSRKLKSVEFPEDSKLEKIESSVFAFTSIENFYIPKSVKILAHDWCDSADKLKKVTISPENKNIKFIDDEHQIVALKSDVKKDVFNIISFVNKSAVKVTIPSFVKKISASSFAYCNNLIKIEIPQNSELWSIGPKSFVSSSLKSLLIPRKVFNLRYSIFWYSSIRSIEFACDFLYNEFKIALFTNAVDLQVISFPNIRFIRFNFNGSNRVSDFLIFINPEAKIEI